MHRTPRLGLRARLTAFLVAAAFAPALAALPFVVSASGAIADKRAADGLRTAGHHAGVRLARALHVPWREVDGLAAMARGDALDGTFRIRLDTAKRLDDRLSWLGVAAPDGRVAMAADGMLEGQDVGARAWFRNGLDGPFAGDVREAVLLQRLLSPGQAAAGEPLRVLDFSMPLRRASDGALLGVIGAHIGWNSVRDLVREAVRPERAEILLVSRDGAVILGPPGLEGARVGHLRGVLAAAGDAAAATTEAEWPDGGRHLSVAMPVPAYRDMPGFGWTLILRQPAAVARAPAREAAMRLLPPLLATGLLLAVAGALLARAVSRPLSRLAASAEAIAAGRLDAPVPRHEGGPREAEVLGTALSKLQGAWKARLPAGAAAAGPEPRRPAEREPAAGLADAHP